MIGEAKFKYSTIDLMKLVKKDLVEKFGNRELSGIDLSVPGVLMAEAKINAYPNPEIVKTSVEEQIAQLHLPYKPDIPRSDNSITRDVEFTGGDSIILSFDRVTNSVKIIGGPVLWSEANLTSFTKSGHWIGVKISFPLGWSGEAGAILPYTHNGVPKYLILDEESVTNKAIVLYFDAAMITNDLSINWSPEFNPEEISISIEASLQDSAIQKVGPLPKEPIYNFTFPSNEDYTSAEICINVDLALGK